MRWLRAIVLCGGSALSLAACGGTAIAPWNSSPGTQLQPGSTAVPPAVKSGAGDSIGFEVTPSRLRRGEAAIVTVTCYRLDTGDASIRGAASVTHNPNPQSIALFFSGPVTEELEAHLNTPVTFYYLGLGSGTEHITASAGSRLHGQTSIEIGKPPPKEAALFVSGVTEYSIGYDSLRATQVEQFPAAAAGTVTPLRNMLMNGDAVAEQSDGSFWTLRGTQTYTFFAFEHYDAFGDLLGTIAPHYRGQSLTNQAAITAATIDANGNAYVVNELESGPAKLYEYLSGNYLTPSRSITLPAGTQTRIRGDQIAVDGSGNVYIAGTCAIERCNEIREYTPGPAGSFVPIRTVSVSDVYAIAVDPVGTIYVLAFSSASSGTQQLLKIVANGAETTMASASNNGLSALAVDGAGTVYLGLSSGQIEEFSAGSSSAGTTLTPGPTELGMPPAISALAVQP